jgi:hypothetical protein
MLVLALQFSKGSERGRLHDDFLTLTPPWCVATAAGSLAESVVQGTPRAAGARAPCHRRGRGPKRVDSLKTEEKTKLVEPACQEDESCD